MTSIYYIEPLYKYTYKKGKLIKEKKVYFLGKKEMNLRLYYVEFEREKDTEGSYFIIVENFNIKLLPKWHKDQYLEHIIRRLFPEINKNYKLTRAYRSADDSLLCLIFTKGKLNNGRTIFFKETLSYLFEEGLITEEEYGLLYNYKVLLRV
ncbi:MAG: hypothetical protein ABGW69_02135 [Nanoarchaeota archaeon]